MLSDTARKLLMIMRNSSVHHRHMPTLQELEKKSGRTPDKIQDGLQELAEDAYILWQKGNPPEKAIIIEGWERTGDKPDSITWGTIGGNTDYWTNH